MSKLTESSTRDDVLEAIYDGVVICFSDLPVSYQTTEIAVFWIENAPAETPLDLDVQYSTVPQRLRTDEFLLAAVKKGCFVLMDTTPKHTGIYREIACLAIANYRDAVNDLDSEFIDEEMLEFVFSHYPLHMHDWVKKVDGLINLMSDDLIHRCCQAYFIFALDAPSNRRRFELGSYLNLNTIAVHVLFHIRGVGRLDLIADKIGEGQWPFQGNKMIQAKEPKSMKESLRFLDKAPPMTVAETLYMASLMLESIEVVVPAMSSNRLKKLLFEMNSEDELAPYLQDDNLLRGAYLEDAFGL